MKLSRTQINALKNRIPESEQVRAVGFDRAEFFLDCPLPTKCALLRKGAIEVAETWGGRSVDLKFYNFGREYRASHSDYVCTRYRLTSAGRDSLK